MFTCRLTARPLIIIALLVCASCARNDDAANNSNKPLSLTFWSATNAQEVLFAREAAREWNAAHEGINIVVQPVPTGQSSEEVVLAAVASQTTPDIYANASPGEMQNLIDARGVVRLSDFSDFKNVVDERMTLEMASQYKSSDGKFYHLAWKSNPVMVLYNTRLLREAGVENLPETYTQFLEAASRVTRTANDKQQWMMTIDVLPIWYKRLFDFYPLYLAASNGAPLLDNLQVTFDNNASIAVFDFLRECFARGYVPRQSFQGDAFVRQIVAARFTGPYSISYLKEYAPPDLEYDFGFVPRPDDKVNDKPSTYADPKSIVIFSTCKHPEAAWEFVKFLTSKRNDKRLLEMTSQLPIRKNLLEDIEFQDFFEREPLMRKFAAQLETARTVDAFAEMQEMFDHIAGEFEASVLYDVKTTPQAVHDAAKRTQIVLDNR